MGSKDLLYPYKFSPIIRTYALGGRRIIEKYNKDILTDKPVAETWEVADHDSDISIIKNGIFTGKCLRGIIWELKEKILGDKIYPYNKLYFPLLLKFIDAKKSLAGQIHADDDYISAHSLDIMGKAEAYYIIEADENAFIYWGIKDGVVYNDVVQAVKDNKILDVCKKVYVKTGDVLPVPQRWIHAIGEGILLYEIQQNADTTFEPRRVKKTIGQETHVLFAGSEAAYMFTEQMKVMNVPDCEIKIIPLSVEKDGNKIYYLYACKYFAIEKLEIEESWESCSDSERFFVFTVLEGECTLEYETGKEYIKKGETILIPAYLGNYKIHSSSTCEIIKTYIPDLKKNIYANLLHEGFNENEIVQIGGYSHFNDILFQSEV